MSYPSTVSTHATHSSTHLNLQLQGQPLVYVHCKRCILVGFGQNRALCHLKADAGALMRGFLEQELDLVRQVLKLSDQPQAITTMG